MSRLLKFYVCLPVFLLWSMECFGQGSTVILPMSKYVQNKDETVRFQLHNQLQEPTTYSMVLECDVDGVQIKGDECKKFFTIKLDSVPNPSKFEVAKRGSALGEVNLLSSPQRYAFIKPIFTPVINTPKKNEGVAFEFSYQPGYIYFVSNDPEKLEIPSYSTRSVNEEKLAVFEFDVSKLPMPGVASISVKIMDKERKKMLRFARLASDKIIDPARKKMKLEAGYALPKDETVTCFDLIIQWLSSNSLQKISNCN